MARHQKTKGATGEREVAVLLQGVISKVYARMGRREKTPRVLRNLAQARCGGCDLVGTPLIAVEVKRCERLNVVGWWMQTLRQAHDVGRVPVLFYRQSAKPWTVSWLPMGGGAVVSDTFEEFVCWYELELENFVRLTVV